jgi:hypothetical protein
MAGEAGGVAGGAGGVSLRAQNASHHVIRDLLRQLTQAVERFTVELQPGALWKLFHLFSSRLTYV